jgi:thiol-disulfide isomerase/thioredoxin
MADAEQPNRKGPSLRLALGTAMISAAAGFGAVYAMARGADNGSWAERPVGEVRMAQASQPLPSGPGANPLSVGEMARFVFKKTPEPLPEITFVDGSGKERTLQDWRGKVVLLNIWATWCLPCRKEMPALDRLQGELGSDKFEVVAISADRAGAEASKKFLDQIKVNRLGLYADPNVRVPSTLKVVGMPATLLLDAEGREVGRLLGPAEWDSEEAKALIRAVIK